MHRTEAFGPLSRRALYRWVVWFQLCNALLLALISLRAFTYSSVPDGWVVWTFLVLMVPGHFLLHTALLYPITAVPALLRPWRWIFPLTVLLYSALLLLLLLDGEVFALYRFHLNGLVWHILVSGEARGLLPISWLTFAQSGAIILFVLGLETALGWGLWLAVLRYPHFRGYRVAAALIVLVAVGQAMHAVADASLYSPITKQMRYLPWLNGTTARRFLYRTGIVQPREAMAAVVPHETSGLHYPLAPLQCQRAERPLNVLFFIMDGWRADTLDAQTTPNAWALAERGERFLNHYSTGNATRYGIFGLMYGLYGTYWNAMLSEQHGSVLIDEAVRQGYRMSIHGSASLRFPEFDRTVFAAVRDRIKFDTEGDTADQRDRRITDDFLGFLAQPEPAPFFGFLFYDSSHQYAYPAGWQGPFQPEWAVVNHLQLSNSFDPLPFKNRYRNSLYYSDQLFGEVIAALRARGQLERTVVVMTGDHGDEFNDNHQNYWGHNSNFSRWQTHTPLAIYWPGQPPRSYEQLTSHVDVVPTLLRKVFGCTSPISDYSNGRDLYDTSPRPYLVMSNYHAMALVEPQQITEMDLFGRTTMVDPQYNELPDAKLPAEHLRAVVRDMARFFKH
jgi:uncharacterized protein